MQTSTRLGVHAISTLLPDLDRQPGPRYRALSAALTAMLLDGRLTPGIRMPSERDLASALRISRSTATAAYDELARDGLLSRRQGSGSYLTLPATVKLRGPASRMSLEGAMDDVLDLSVACLPAIPGVIESALAAVGPLVGRYPQGDGYHPYGVPELRAAVAARYRARGVPTEPDQILVTNGAQHAFDLVLRLAVSPGDRVLTDMPTYPGALDAIRQSGARAVTVPFKPGGDWDVAAIRNAIRQTAPRLAFLIPDFHNPTGALMTTDVRREVLAAARRAGTTVVVDESFVELDLREPPATAHPSATAESPGMAESPGTAELPGTAESPATAELPMASLEPSAISLGSLSKPIWAGLRVGWLRAAPDAVQRLAAIRARSDMGGPVIEQLMATRLLPELDSIVTRRRAELRIKRDVLLRALAVELPHWRPSRPLGGLSSWVELDAAAATQLTHRLEQRGVLITPGARFAVDGTLERYLRIPFALPSGELVRAVELIKRTWSELGPSARPQRDTHLVTT